jgi:hypothetical protein
LCTAGVDVCRDLVLARLRLFVGPLGGALVSGAILAAIVVPVVAVRVVAVVDVGAAVDAGALTVARAEHDVHLREGDPINSLPSQPSP